MLNIINENINILSTAAALYNFLLEYILYTQWETYGNKQLWSTVISGLVLFLFLFFIAIHLCKPPSYLGFR